MCPACRVGPRLLEVAWLADPYTGLVRTQYLASGRSEVLVYFLPTLPSSKSPFSVFAARIQAPDFFYLHY